LQLCSRSTYLFFGSTTQDRTYGGTVLAFLEKKVLHIV